MTDGVMTSFISVIPPTLAALAGLWVSIKNSYKADKSISKADENIAKADEIHVLVNANLSEVKRDLALALERVSSLEKLLIGLTGKRPSSSPQLILENEIQSGSDAKDTKKAQENLAKPNDSTKKT